MLKNRLEQLVEQGLFDTFNGAVLIKQGQDTLFRKSFGYANRSFDIPNTMETKFRIASVSKIFTAVSILQWVEKGELSLDASIVDLLNLQDTKISKEVTIHHLLSHTSGIADYYDESEDDAFWIEMWKKRPIYEVRSLEDYVVLFRDLEPLEKPGKVFRYNNAGYILLGLVIEKLSGMSYEAYVCEHIFKKLDMKQSGFYSLDEVVPHMAEGYEQMDGKWMRNIYTATPTGASDGGAVTTADDLMKFAYSLMDGALLSDQYLKLLLSPQVIDEESNGYRDYIWKYGYANYYLLDKEEHIVRRGHPGEEYGVSCRLYHYPDSDIHVIILGNEGFNAGSLGWTIHDVIVGE